MLVNIENFAAVIFTLLLALSNTVIDGANILGIFPGFSRSHYIMGQSLFVGLAKNGHNLTLVSQFRLYDPMDNIEEIRLDGIYQKFKDHTAEDDSDMLMEPDTVQPRTVVTALPETDSSTPADTNESAAQNFYPFYRDTSSLGQGRQFYTFPQQTDFHQAAAPNYNLPRSHDAAVLGSGDFGVIRGGTFYQDNDPPTREVDYFNYYSNGHGRPHSPYYVQKYNFHDEQFANFRDFADINTPGDPAYSEFVVVYANKNATLAAAAATDKDASKNSTPPVKTNPKNIFEQLELLDKENSKEVGADKLSKTKIKLKTTKLEKKYQKSKLPLSKEAKQTAAEVEPLLALS